jgi:hypothetical protein
MATFDPIVSERKIENFDNTDERESEMSLNVGNYTP